MDPHPESDKVIPESEAATQAGKAKSQSVEGVRVKHEDVVDALGKKLDEVAEI